MLKPVDFFLDRLGGRVHGVSLGAIEAGSMQPKSLELCRPFNS
jgi:hypothetical protein